MGAGAKSPTPLASFDNDWVGGDIHGLSAYAGTLYGYVPEMTDVATALTGKVRSIVGDAGWQGSAAAAFTTAWNHDATGVTALAIMVSATGDIVNTLAVNLASLEHALEQAAEMAVQHGVGVGADGQPPQVCYASATAESWRVSYQSFYGKIMTAATAARIEAASALSQLGTAATQTPGGKGLAPGDQTALFDVLAGFFGAQTRYRAYVDSKIPGLKTRLAEARTNAIEEARQANGRFGPWTDQGQEDFGAAKSGLTSVEDQLAAAQATENPFSKAWGFSPSDISAVGSKLDGLGGTSGDLARFTGDIPFVDVAAAGASTYFGAQDDIAKGISPYAAYPAEGAGNIAAVATGGYVGGLAAGGTASALGALGASGLGVTFAAGGAGVLLGGAAAYGVGDFAHNLIQENWGGDIHRDGVVLGIGYGVGDAAAKTGEDFAHLATGAWHGVEHVWDSIF